MTDPLIEHPHMTLSTTLAGSVAVLSVSGDVDMSSAPLLEKKALDLLDADHSGLVVDLSAVDFLASMGIALLVELSKRAPGNFAFAVVARGSATARPLEMLGLGDVLSIYPHLEEALAALEGASEDSPE
ncbi:STAS domain-containing protein [Rhodococcus chondri]|uniref:Anti-sigma factor antagonist n=1 Tax=Rhodococcus chondri TaxID=3065941 RepID=A0ABU7JWW5_9NOCA|nr:STAS domain-containing protein [Rhodococcus sp. CC-R104]MEE2034516.1 STAS domain-containing protein [Rhodococcus sp. CC-R104]